MYLIFVLFNSWVRVFASSFLFYSLTNQYKCRLYENCQIFWYIIDRFVSNTNEFSYLQWSCWLMSSIQALYCCCFYFVCNQFSTIPRSFCCFLRKSILRNAHEIKANLPTLFLVKYFLLNKIHV